jgi:hypothetical protein
MIFSLFSVVIFFFFFYYVFSQHSGTCIFKIRHYVVNEKDDIIIKMAVRKTAHTKQFNKSRFYEAVGLGYAAIWARFISIKVSGYGELIYAGGGSDFPSRGSTPPPSSPPPTFSL